MPQKVQCLEMGRSSTWISRCSRVTGCWLKIFKDLQGIRNHGRSQGMSFKKNNDKSQLSGSEADFPELELPKREMWGRSYHLDSDCRFSMVFPLIIPESEFILLGLPSQIAMLFWLLGWSQPSANFGFDSVWFWKTIRDWPNSHSYGSKSGSGFHIKHH